MATPTVLIIDDDPYFTDLLAAKIQRLGLRPATALSLEQGLEVLAHSEPALVYLDVNLPDGSGLDAIAAVKQSASSPEIIIVTGAGEADGAALAIESGAWDYVQKGRSMQEILHPLEHALEYRRERLAARRSLDLDLEGIVGSSPALRACHQRVAQAANSDANVLLRGETGTGKELFARAIHRNSSRSTGEFVVVDCAALPENLVETILFGHSRGAFTGAESDRMGLVRRADGGTLFLDEIAELPLNSQRSFLRVLQERRFRPVGSDAEANSDFRLVAATNRDLDEWVARGSFREDLLFRVRAFEILLPPLRERDDDVVEIARHLVPLICERNGVALKDLSPAVLHALKLYRWPGNVRELSHTLERAVAVAAEQQSLLPVHLPTEVRVAAARASVQTRYNVDQQDIPYPSIHSVRESAEAAYLRTLLQDAGGDMDRACALAELSRSRLYELLKKHGLSRADF